MINNWINETTTVQVLLDTEARISNVLADKNLPNNLTTELQSIREMLHKQIEYVKGPMPHCYGNDDCSTQCMSVCPWRITCGT